MNTQLSPDDPTPCPVCRQPGGFHDLAVHNAHLVPRQLAWKPGEPTPWEWKQHVGPSVAPEDHGAVLKVLRGMSKELLS